MEALTVACAPDHTPGRRHCVIQRSSMPRPRAQCCRRTRCCCSHTYTQVLRTSLIVFRKAAGQVVQPGHCRACNRTWPPLILRARTTSCRPRTTSSKATNDEGEMEVGGKEEHGARRVAQPRRWRGPQKDGAIAGNGHVWTADACRRAPARSARCSSRSARTLTRRREYNVVD